MISSPVDTVDIRGTSVGSRWGIPVVEYQMNIEGVATKVDFQDLLVQVCEQKALVIESQIKPLSLRITSRNDRLTKLGNALSTLAAFSAKFDTSKPAPNAWAKVDQNLVNMLSEFGLTYDKGKGSWWSVSDSQEHSKAAVDEATQKFKTEIDRLNNASQMSMNRLQGLTSSRDNNFNIASSNMNHISESRSTTIKGMSF